jgi:hypothetical protein
MSSVRRTPLPVMLRQMGYSSAISACMAAPAATAPGLVAVMP